MPCGARPESFICGVETLLRQRALAAVPALQLKLSGLAEALRNYSEVPKVI